MKAYDLTYQRITRGLGFAIGLRDRDAYRDSLGVRLAGEWLGAFAQPSVLLNKVTPISARFDEVTGAMIDEYGESRLTLTEPAGDRVDFVKQYATQSFHYHGFLGDGTLAGYWYSHARIEFTGVFWLQRAELFDEATSEMFRRRVRSSSPRRVVAQIALPVLFIGPVFAFPYPAVLASTIAANGALLWLIRRRMRDLQREVALWRADLG